jgi:hypothetical protein
LRALLELHLGGQRDVVAEQQQLLPGARSIASRRVRGGCSAFEPPPAESLERLSKIAARPACSACSATSSQDARTTMTRSLAPLPDQSCGLNPCSAKVARFTGVAIAAAAHSTPSTARIARVPDSCTTEST